MQHDPIVITSALRTPIGNFQGCLSSVTTPELGAHVIKHAIEGAHLNGDDIEEVYMGCVLPAGLGQAPARQAALAAGLPLKCGATTLNKMCGSGLKSIMLAHDLLMVNPAHILVAGGMESMSNAPYLLDKARAGYRLGHGQVKDHMFLDGLEDAYERGKLMGFFADETANEYRISREQQDEFAITSINRAQKAQEDGSFEQEIVPMVVQSRKSETVVNVDEGPTSARPEKIPSLRPAFNTDGTVTAANASSISDGAAAVSLMRRSLAVKRGLTPLATILGHATHAQRPERFTTAPVGAINKLLTQVGWQAGSVDLYEINEAFAVVTLAAIQDLKLAAEKVNVHGGACILGHPIGASGARILVTLIHALHKYDLKRGVASLCIGGGEAVAVAIEVNS